MKQTYNKKECTCEHNVGHRCNARFCWCDEHWQQSIDMGFIVDNTSKEDKEI